MPNLESLRATSRLVPFALLTLPFAITAVLWSSGGAALAAYRAWQRIEPPTAGEIAQADLLPSKGRGSSRYDGLILEYAKRYSVEPALVKAVMRTESGFRPRVRSAAGARGLMQVMPRTGRAYGARDLFDPKQNVRAGVRHLRYLLDRHDGDPVLAVAAYNVGSSAVEQYGGVPPYRETRHYVARVMRSLRAYRGQMKAARVASSGSAKRALRG